MENSFWLYVVLFLLGVLITRAIFSIPQIVRALITNARLSAMIAEKQGCDPEKISTLLEYMQPTRKAGWQRK